MRNAKALAITIGAIVAIGLILVYIVDGPDGLGFRFSRWFGDGAESSSGSNRVSESSEKTREGVSSFASDSGSKPTASSVDPAADPEAAQARREATIYFGIYDDFLNSLGRKPTREEEDAMLANSNRDPQVLLGLVLVGSARAAQFLREALEKAPDNPLVHYQILHRGDPGFDRLASAQKLVSLVPNDAELRYAAAVEAFAAGDRTLAMDDLRTASTLSEFASLRGAEFAARLEIYRQTGSNEELAQARVALDFIQPLGLTAIFKLHGYLFPGASPGDSIVPSDWNIPPGSEEMVALLLDAQRKVLNNKALSLDSYLGARGMESEYLKAFFRANVSGENPAAVSYLSAPATELLSAADAELARIEPVTRFMYDKPGVYQRLSPYQQWELVKRIEKDGELSAFQWAYGVRPDIFRSPDFKPQGTSKAAWAEYLKSSGNPLGADQSR